LRKKRGDGKRQPDKQDWETQRGADEKLNFVGKWEVPQKLLFLKGAVVPPKTFLPLGREGDGRPRVVNQLEKRGGRGEGKKERGH